MSIIGTAVHSIALNFGTHSNGITAISATKLYITNKVECKIIDFLLILMLLFV
jgi:hypothetical protein